VHGISGLRPEFIKLQFESVLSDIGVDGAKTGMLLDRETVCAVAEKIAGSSIPHVVVDPVILSSGGDVLLEEAAIALLIEKLIPLAGLLTPNLSEAEKLSGLAIASIEDMKKAAFRVRELGCKAVLIKGGHLDTDPVDLLFDGDRFVQFPGRRLDVDVHGTGCTLSAAILASLIRGQSLEMAVATAKTYVARAMHDVLKLGKSTGLLNHFIRPEEPG
jgi:hydroxymethylpyrimidine/phosphomethylpyrimidine kinase